MDVNVTNAVIGAIGVAVGWLFKSVIQLGKDVVGLQTAFKFYLERTSKGAAMVLDSPNPTPPEVRRLLQKHVAGGKLTGDERETLLGYLRRLKNDQEAPKSERSAAIQLLAAMETMSMVTRH